MNPITRILPPIFLQEGQPSRVSEIGRHFGETPGAQAARVAFLILALIIAGVILFYGMRRLLAKAIAKSEAEALFLQLCREHRLSRRDRDLLKHVSAEQDLPTPAALFVRKTIVDKAFEEETSPDRKQNLQALRARLFS